MTSILLLFVMGIAIGRHHSTPTTAVDVLDWFVIRVALPALIFDRIRELDFQPEAVVPVAMAWLSGGLVAIVVAIVARRSGWDRTVTGSVLLCSTLGNTSFLGYPATAALLGAEHLPAAIVFDQLGSFLALATWGSFVAATFGKGASLSAVKVARKIGTFPPFCALCIGIGLHLIRVPGAILDPVNDTVALVGTTVTPLAIVAVGLRVHAPPVASLKPTAVGIALKMVFAPAVVLLAAWALAADGVAWDVSAFQAAAPPMVTASVVAYDAELDASIATAMTTLGLVMAFASLPLIAWIVT